MAGKAAGNTVLVLSLVCMHVFFLFFVLAATPWLGMNDQGNHAPPHVVGGT